MSTFETEKPHESSSARSSNAAAAAPAPATRASEASGPHDLIHLDRVFQGSARRPASRAAETLFSFLPGAVSFRGAGREHVTIRNTTDDPQTIDEWDMVGDRAAFQTTFLGDRSITLEPRQVAGFDVEFTAESDQPRAASLLVRSMFGDAEPARLNMTGTKRGGAAGEQCSGVRIEASTRDGRPNSVRSAMASVGAALGGVSDRQQHAIKEVERAAGTEIPKLPPWWAGAFDSVVAEGLCRGLAMIGDRLTGGVAHATWKALSALRAGWAGIVVEKKLIALNKQLHEHVVGGMAKGVTAKGVGGVRESVMTQGEPAPAALRRAFFRAQIEALTGVYADAVTTLNNAEGDYVALEAQAPGLAFAALDAYREHLRCAPNVAQAAASHALGMWSAFLARMELGTHEPESWERATSGVAIEKNLYGATDARHRLRDVARGVLEVGVVWSYDRRRDAPIAAIRHARVEGLQPELKETVSKQRLGELPMPIIVHGKVTQDSYAPRTSTHETSQLRIGRNEGGAISVGAERGSCGAAMLADLGAGDSFDGARALFAHVDQLVLAKVD